MTWYTTAHEAGMQILVSIHSDIDVTFHHNTKTFYGTDVLPESSSVLFPSPDLPCLCHRHGISVDKTSRHRHGISVDKTSLEYVPCTMYHAS